MFRLCFATALSTALLGCAAVAVPAKTQVVIHSLSPDAGPPGSVVVVSGSGFTSDNAVLIAWAEVDHVASADGATLRFQIPAVLNPSCFAQGCRMPSQIMRAGTYKISIRNQHGVSNAVAFVVR